MGGGAEAVSCGTQQPQTNHSEREQASPHAQFSLQEMKFVLLCFLMTFELYARHF
jgi:hypothetical protein